MWTSKEIIDALLTFILFLLGLMFSGGLMIAKKWLHNLNLWRESLSERLDSFETQLQRYAGDLDRRRYERRVHAEFVTEDKRKAMSDRRKFEAAKSVCD